MYIVYKVYDDDSAIILDIGTFGQSLMTRTQLIKFGSEHDVLGLSVTNNNLNYIKPYNAISFASEEEADDYIKDEGLSYKNKRYACNYWWVFEKKDEVFQEQYCICTYREYDRQYIGTKKNYTPYINAAKIFSKADAQKQAAVMSAKSKTGTCWIAMKVRETVV